MGTADNYFLDKAMRLLESFLHKAQPPYAGKLHYGNYKGHCWRDITDRQMMEQMMVAMAQQQKAN